MKTGLATLVALTASALNLFAGSPRGADQPEVEIRLQSHLTSYATPRGFHFRCVVIRPFEVDGHLLMPSGTIIFGTVRRRTPVGLGLVHERAGLDLSFDSYQTPDGVTLPLRATLASIDNAREEVTANGRIKGILAANNPGNLVGGLWFRPNSSLIFRSLIGLTGASNQVWKTASFGPIGAAGIFAVRCVLFSFPEPEIHLPPGTDMKLRVQLPLPDQGEVMTAQNTPVPEEFKDWIEARMGQVFLANGQLARDPINVVLKGSKQDLISSFQGSGWILADTRSLKTLSRVYLCFSSRQSYSAAPVSRLYFRGVNPDLVFEKSLDTVTQRHHIRLWNAGEFEGETVWMGAATHDAGVAFKLKSMRFTHTIETNVDIEREKIVTDLVFAGCSTSAKSLDFSAAPPVPGDSRIRTDGHVSVLEAQSCLTTGASDSPAPPDKPGTIMSRFTRRAILETRNYLLRDNSYYWLYRFIRSRHANRA